MGKMQIGNFLVTGIPEFPQNLIRIFMADYRFPTAVNRIGKRGNAYASPSNPLCGGPKFRQHPVNGFESASELGGREFQVGYDVQSGGGDGPFGEEKVEIIQALVD